MLDANVRVLHYVKKILDSRFAVKIWDDADLFLHGLQTHPPCDLVIMSWQGIAFSSRMLRQLAQKKARVLLLIRVLSPDEIEVVSQSAVVGLLQVPFTHTELQQSVQRYLPDEAADDGRPAPTVPEETPLGEGLSFLRASRRMAEVETHAKAVARADIPVLILGESGTGKEVLAKYIHSCSARSGKVFLKVNCAAMPADLIESELFGYEQGAFTGAIKSKPGKFELCDGGTIFLDEIGEMPPPLQAKLLHVLQDGAYSRLGSRAPMRVDVRVIAATNIDIKSAMMQKTFREDLYYRLNGFSVTLPPLRERPEEIVPFADHFMRKASRRHGRESLPFSETLMTALRSYPWPGNLREMENVINRYLIMNNEPAIIADLNLRLDLTTGSADEETAGVSRMKAAIKREKGNAESLAIASILEETRWNRKAAASKMEMSYKSLLYKIKQYDLSPPTMQRDS